MEPVWSAKNIEWDLQLTDMEITSDADLLVQVWTNLIQNAVKFSSPGGLIEVSVRPEGAFALFTVRDHGIGMTEEAAARAFEMFYQADRSRNREGVGLGLSLARRIVRMLSGTIELSTAPGEGSTFTVRVPIHPAGAV